MCIFPSLLFRCQSFTITYTSFYSTNISNIIHQIQQNFEKEKLEWYEIKVLEEAYPEIRDAHFKGALRTFKQQLALKMRVTTGQLTCYHWNYSLLQQQDDIITTCVCG